MDDTLVELLERNPRHVESLPTDHFAAVEDGQEPTVVSICCSDSRVSQEGMFDVEEPGWLFTPSTIGNQVWDRHDGERVVDGSVLYPVAATGTETVAVVGHTDCGAVTAALDAVRDEGETGSESSPAGIAKWVGLLVPVVEAGLADGCIDVEVDDPPLVDRLVEYNVDRQVEFLRDSPELSSDVSVYGFVYDVRGSYGGDRGRAYLVNANGETDPGALAKLVPERLADGVGRLLRAGENTYSGRTDHRS